ncbi:universal stress protein [Nocardioides currus]|uniref:UspA domain-containing protein n=1 Tax=Nocardioides currus TaxID=2133958 RepID=A0A2R7YSG0_9ACTN|nr:universal stress protein [Nocardioides currus]PUA79330.1 hypothetical protein C7S10_20155 [Nocardioides currus]
MTMSKSETTRQRTSDVVVGVDGTPASVNAMRYALRAATLSGGRVEVYHVVPDVVPMTGVYPLPPDDFMAAGRSTLETTVAQAGPATAVEVDTHLCRGPVVKTLTTAGRDAHAIVVGSDRRTAPMRLLTGNVSTGVAARAAVPVVSVPETWRADGSTRTVVVGIKRPDHSDALVGEALAVAQASGSRLVVLHAWRFPAAYDDVIVSDRATLDEWAARAEREVDDLVDPWRRSHPDVDVEVRVVHDFAAHALVEASREADELVLVRRAHGFPAAAHLGASARTVLLHAHCPVRIVPAGDAPVAREPELDAPAVPVA